jgi:hypothetical protein
MALQYFDWWQELRSLIQPTGSKNRNTYIATLICLIPASIAKGKSRSFGFWWFYGAALFIVALPHALIMKANNSAIEQQQLAEGMKRCPHCAELIKPDANVGAMSHLGPNPSFQRRVSGGR